MKKPIVQFTKVSYQVNGFHAIERVSLTVNEGDYVGLVGPNGSGKTTLIRLLLGLIRPTAGEVRVFDEDPESVTARLRIGYVPQRAGQSEASFPVTVQELVESGLIGRKNAHHVEHALDLVGVRHLRARRVSELSGGERQRVYIARSLVGDPRLLILDEPTSGIDEVAEHSLYALLSKLHGRGISIILVSHDLETVAQEVDHVLCLNRRLVYDGQPEEFLHEVAAGNMYPKTHRLISHHHAG